MTEYIIDENNSLIHYSTDKDGELKRKKIANFTLETLFIIKVITNTKNKLAVVEKRVLKLIKEDTPNEHYIKILDGKDEIDLKSFLTIIYKETRT